MGELTSGLKKTDGAKFYTLLFILIRFLSVLTVVIFSGKDEPKEIFQDDQKSNVFYVEAVFLIIFHMCFSFYL